MSEFSHLKNKLLAEQVEDQIYHYILDEALEPGAKLPNEFALGEKFRVGRSTIREAVKLLSSKGIVEVRQGSGTYVVTTVKGLSDPLNLRSVQDKNALAFDLVNVRLLLEPGIAEMAAQNATPEDIERLRRLCERVETKIHEGDRYIEDDIAFHTCIAESSGAADPGHRHSGDDVRECHPQKTYRRDHHDPPHDHRSHCQPRPPRRKGCHGDAPELQPQLYQKGLRWRGSRRRHHRHGGVCQLIHKTD